MLARSIGLTARISAEVCVVVDSLDIALFFRKPLLP